MDFFKQQAASFLDSQKDEEGHKKKPASSESEEYSSSGDGYGKPGHNYGGGQESNYGGEPRKHNYGGGQESNYGGEPGKHNYGGGQESNYGGGQEHSESTKHSYGEPTKQGHEKAQDDDVPSYKELMSSASVLMEAAKGQFGGGGSAGEGKGKKADTDPAKLAAAAQDMIDAAQHYGKLDESSPMGAYLKKAEGYLQSYQKNPREAEAAVRDLSESRRDSDEPEERRRY